jgi:hypothetical protein
MKLFPKNPREQDRRAMRRWTLISLGLYGSIVAGLFMYATFTPNRDAGYATIRTTVAIEDSGVPRP